MIEHLTMDTFKEKVFNFTENKEWKFEGDKPCIIDFYADWCGPCRALTPTVEKLSKKYANDFVMAKIDVDTNPEIAQHFGVRSIPSLFFIHQ